MPVDEFTIEHILPQNEQLSHPWRYALGNDWRGVQERLLHTLGNLTLTAYNAEYSDRTFREKRDMKGGFHESPLRINGGLREVETWNEASICERAERLARLAVDVWKGPTLSVDVLSTYRVKEEESRLAYTIADHRHLQENSLMLELFEEFRKEVLAP